MSLPKGGFDGSPVAFPAMLSQGIVSMPHCVLAKA
jgi:hypothetical protein